MPSPSTCYSTLFTGRLAIVGVLIALEALAPARIAFRPCAAGACWARRVIAYFFCRRTCRCCGPSTWRGSSSST